MKKYILIAGVNGAGKSTLYQTLESLKGMKRINTDEIVRTFGSWKNLKQIMKKCKLVVLYDNTEVFNRFAIYKDGSLVMISEDVPKWYKLIEE